MATECRLGEYTEVFYSMGAKVIGRDINIKCIQFCRDFYKDKRIEFIGGNITNLEMMPQGQFDIIFCIGALPYLRKKILSEKI